MFMAYIAGVRVLYTGDYSREEDCHLCAAEIPQFSLDICISESTYGVQLHQLHQPHMVREEDSSPQPGCFHIIFYFFFGFILFQKHLHSYLNIHLL